MRRHLLRNGVHGWRRIFGLEEVGHWLPQSSGLLTPLGSDEPFQAKISFFVIRIML